MGSERLTGLLCAMAGVTAVAGLALWAIRESSGVETTSAIKRAPSTVNLAAPARSVLLPAPQPSSDQTHIEAARRFNHSSALLALSVLADSAMEHYRGSFDNPAMYTPLFSAALSLLAGLHGGRDHRQQTHHLRHTIYLGAAVAGIAGTGFHLYNITKRPGGWSWNNLFHAAPIGAPMALLLSGALGAVAEQLRDEPAHDPQLLGVPAGRALGLLVSAGLVGTVGEVALLHFRGAFQHRAMYAPIIVPPLAAALLAQAALAEPAERPLTRLWLRITTVLGLVGSGLHARGIARRQGGWRNWSQNLFSGPPLPAPPSFSALALAGLATLRLRESET